MPSEPSFANNRLPVVRARVPRPLETALNTAAANAGQTRSACLRELIISGLAQRGLWPPALQEDSRNEP